MAADGQVTNSATHTVFKTGASKVKRADKGACLVGLRRRRRRRARAVHPLRAQARAVRGNFERAVIELAMDWRTDRVLRQLEAQMIVADRDRAFLVMGNGDLLEPDEDGVLAIGSGGNYAMAAARALLRHTDLPARRVAEEAMVSPAELCVYTNDRLTFEELEPA
jgi:ATP-dependent HslUV protease subunit HslV